MRFFWLLLALGVIGYFFYDSIYTFPPRPIQTTVEYAAIFIAAFSLFIGLSLRSSRKRLEKKRKLKRPSGSKKPPKTNQPKSNSKISPNEQKRSKSLSEVDVATEKVALRLRELAVKLEDLSQIILIDQRNLMIERITKSQSIVGPALLVLGRIDFYTAFLNANARTGTQRKIHKRYSELIGCDHNDYVFVLKDESLVRYSTTNSEDALFLSTAWQVLAPAMNSSAGSNLTQKEVAQSLAKQIREAATYIEENSHAVWVEKRIDLEKLVQSAKPSEALPTKSPTKKLGIGDMLVGYELIAKLGEESGFGEVYKATDGDSEIAIKVMKARGGAQPDSAEFHKQASEFLMEAKISSDYRHIPFLVTSLDHGDEPWPWIAYPLVQGKTVSERVGQSFFFKGAEWWNLAHDMLAALAELHEDGLIHRDIKYDNVMVTRDRAVILDLGISQVEGYSKTDRAEVGALELTAPEVLSIYGQRSVELSSPITTAADIYCLGLTLYMARTGKKPYASLNRSIESESDIEELLAYRRQVAFDTSQFETEEIRLLARMMNFEPQERISAREALEICASHVDVEAKAKLFEEQMLEVLMSISSAEARQFSETETFDIDGPFVSWQKLQSITENICYESRPKYFVIEIHIHGMDEPPYFQAFADGDGWHLEARSEIFSEVNLSAKQKTSFMDNGWEPPVSTNPNFSKSLPNRNPDGLFANIVSAFEQSYGYQRSTISKFRVSVTGKGYF